VHKVGNKIESSVLVDKCGQTFSFPKISIYVAVDCTEHVFRNRQANILISANKAVKLRSWFYLVTSLKKKGVILPHARPRRPFTL